jgi:hypothetical protein
MGPVIYPRGSHIAKVNRDCIWPPSARASAIVSGAGSAEVNGQYDYDGTKWVKGAYTIEAAPHWSIRSGATIFYTATATEFPWEAPVWIVGAGGSAPPPSVDDIK